MKKNPPKITYWKHKVMRHWFPNPASLVKESGAGEYVFAVHEVYFGAEGKVVSWTQEPVKLYDCDLKGLVEEVDRIQSSMPNYFLKEPDVIDCICVKNKGKNNIKPCF